jgi:hypothetical protein
MLAISIMAPCFRHLDCNSSTAAFEALFLSSISVVMATSMPRSLVQCIPPSRSQWSMKIGIKVFNNNGVDAAAPSEVQQTQQIRHARRPKLSLGKPLLFLNRIQCERVKDRSCGEGPYTSDLYFSIKDATSPTVSTWCLRERLINAKEGRDVAPRRHTRSFFI